MRMAWGSAATFRTINGLVASKTISRRIKIAKLFSIKVKNGFAQINNDQNKIVLNWNIQFGVCYLFIYFISGFFLFALLAMSCRNRSSLFAVYMPNRRLFCGFFCLRRLLRFYVNSARAFAQSTTHFSSVAVAVLSENINHIYIRLDWFHLSMLRTITAPSSGTRPPDAAQVILTVLIGRLVNK